MQNGRMNGVSQEITGRFIRNLRLFR